MTLRPNSVVYEVIYDPNKQRATGVRIIDSETKKTYDYFSKVIFLCASAIPSTSILMQSKSNRFPNGMGNDSGELGHNLMDHHFKIGQRLQQIYLKINIILETDQMDFICQDLEFRRKTKPNRLYKRLWFSRRW